MHVAPFSQTNLNGKSIQGRFLSFFSFLDEWQMENLFSSEFGAWTLSWREERKKRELQRKFEEPCAPEGLPALPFSGT